MATNSPGFNNRERRILAALAEAVMPAGRLLPAGDKASTILRLEAFLQGRGSEAVTGYKTFLWTLEGAALARYLRPFSSLSRDTRETMLQRWHGGELARRVMLRLATLPLKVAHYNDPAMFELMGCPYRPEKASPENARWRSQILSGDDLDDATDTLEADVVVVGTGAGGAVVAKELAAKGWAVLMLEEGRYYDRQEFTERNRLDLNTELYRGKGVLPTVGNTTIALMVGKSVGGTTTVNSGTCFRTPNPVLKKWRKTFGLSAFTSEHMAPFFERVEEVLGVEPAKWDHLGGVAEVVRDGCEKLGYSHHPLDRNAPGCDGQGVCCFGCPTDAKRSTNVSYVPMALSNNATCLTGARVVRVLTEDKRAVGVEAELSVDGGQRTRKIRVKAPYVVLSCGTVYTPLLLLQNGLCNRFGQVGRHLTIHPAFGINALFDREIRGWDAIPQGYCIDEFKEQGILFEGAFVPLEMATMAFPIIGRPFTAAMEAFNHIAIFGFMISDTRTGRVRASRGLPLITYNLDREAVRKLQRGALELGRVFFAAGAKRLYAPVAGHEIMDNEDQLYAMSQAKVRAWDFELSAYHPLGTCRMGSDPRLSVVDDRHQTHQVSNLFIVDGSCVPSSLGVNPQITIMALATRFSFLLHERMKAEGR